MCLHQVEMGGPTHQELPLEEPTKSLAAYEALPLCCCPSNLGAPRPDEAGGRRLEVELVDVFSETAIFDLILTARETGDGLATFWGSAPSCSKRTRWADVGHFARLLTHVVAYLDMAVGTAAARWSERRTLLVDYWTRQRLPAPEPQSRSRRGAGSPGRRPPGARVG